MYIIDTNILIYHFNRNIPENSRLKLRQIFQDHFNISIISKMEFLGFRKHTASTFTQANRFLGFANVVGIDDEIVEIVISLKRKIRIKLPDAIIAASAIRNNWTLVTRDETDFKNIDVVIYNPFTESNK